MPLSRRDVMTTAGAAAAALPGASLAAVKPRRPAPPGFLWGTAISAHQSEGNNVNSDAWLLENIKPTLFRERSADACDSYHRYAEDIALAARLGFNCYRLGIEWARIEPSEGKFSNAELDHYAKVLEAHRKGYAAIKAARPTLPVGVTLTMQDIQASGPDSMADAYRQRLYGDWTETARSHADWVGVQTYTRQRVDSKGPIPAPAGAEMTAAGYEFYPEALGATIRWAHTAIGKPIYVTENGIATDDDARRIAFVDRALTSVRGCIDEGIPVRSYMYWSLLDNFEWTAGYGQHFGLVAVDLKTFKRTPKPSAVWLGKRAKENRL